MQMACKYRGKLIENQNKPPTPPRLSAGSTKNKTLKLKIHVSPTQSGGSGREPGKCCHHQINPTRSTQGRDVKASATVATRRRM